MSKINILSPFVADLIAAGEVVERPGAVVKELMENAIDAGAENITVEIKDGGMTYIRVTDDGSGMSPEDAGLAFTRHATSKLQDERSLASIGTLGFRGEALAAIAAVSNIELITCQEGDHMGTRAVLQAGEIQDIRPQGCPRGTTMIVRDLFFNTPARLKFQKSDRAEGAYCLTAALRCALGRPEVSVRFIRNEKEEFFSPGDGQVESCLYSLLGREFALGLIRAASEDDAVLVHGYVSSPRSGRGSRSGQYFFCNGRYIKSPALQAALEQAYKNTLLTGRFPAGVLYIELNPALVDVNVHPTKVEVKFSDERRVFDGVYYAVLSALERESGLGGQPAAPGTANPKSPGAPFGIASPERKPAAGSSPLWPGPGEGGQIPPVFSSGFTRCEPPPAGGGEVPGPPDNLFCDGAMVHYQTRLNLPRDTSSLPLSEVQGETADPGEGCRLVGEIMGTYILAEEGEVLHLIDKHAAHERILFDRLKAEAPGFMSQSLLSPLLYTSSPGDIHLLLSHAHLLEKLGFQLEPFGENTLALRAVCADVDAALVPALLDEICEKLRLTGAMGEDEIRDGVLHTVACKAAIKAGRRSDPRELEVLVDRVLSGEVKYCPHGRPVLVSITKKELDRQFKRS